MIKCLAPCNSVGGQVFLSMNNTMNQTIKEAASVSISLHKQIDPYKLPADTKIKLEALGQCLRSLINILDDDKHQNTTTQ